MSNLNPAVLKITAQALADTVPDWAGRKFNPLLSWWQESTPDGQSTPEGHGSDIVLLGSDGRKVRFNPDQVKQIDADDAEKKATAVIELPTSPAFHGDASPHVSHGSTSAITAPYWPGRDRAGTDVSNRVPIGGAGPPVPGTSQGEKPASSTRYSRVRPGRKPNPPASPQAGK
jgi:hypothetical protein